MNRNIVALRAACDQLGLSYTSHHPTGNLVSVHIDGARHVFANWSTPLNSQSEVQLCKDKDYFYAYFKDVIPMPDTLSFLDPAVGDKYQDYLQAKSTVEIGDVIERRLDYPIILKRNRGSFGRNVFKVDSREELDRRLRQIFDKRSAGYDYVCLAQRYVDIAAEYRVLCLYGECCFAYEKDTGGARFVGNLSPLHWEDANARLVTDADLIARFGEFLKPLFDKHLIPYCGMDVIEDRDGRMWLIEANSSPGFACAIRDGAKDEVISLYRAMLTSLRRGETAPSG